MCLDHDKAACLLARRQRFVASVRVGAHFRAKKRDLAQSTQVQLKRSLLEDQTPAGLIDGTAVTHSLLGSSANYNAQSS